MLHLKSKKFQELSLTELYELLKLRQEIFVVEQDCPYLDADGLDQESLHIMGFQSDKMLAYARVIPAGLQYENYTAIGRVVSSLSIRRQKLGTQLFKFALETCINTFPESKIKLSSQVYIKSFYANFGFKEIGESYLEDDIPHIAMIYDKHL